MTLQEARQQIDACECQITSAYYDLRNAARAVGSAGYNAVFREKEQIEREVDGSIAQKARKRKLSLLIFLIFSLMFFAASHPIWGVMLIIVGIFGPLLLQPAEPEEDKRIKEANGMLDSISHAKSSLNSTLANNNTI